MKKIVFLFGFLFLAMLNTSAQSQKGVKQVNAGIGFSNHGIPLYGGVEFGVHPDFTIGGDFSFYTGSGSLVKLGAVGNYHFNYLFDLDPEWDVYGGAKLGFIFSDTSSSGLHLGVQVGGRYFFQNNLGLNFELGGGNITLGAKVGITYRF